MQLNRLSILVVAIVVGCSGSTEPLQLDGTYKLKDIDGRTLPTPPAFTPGLTPTVVSSVVAFEPNGTATLSDHLIEWNGVDQVVTSSYTYTVRGFDISFDVAPCPIGAICALPSGVQISGKIVGSELLLIRGHVNQDPIVYHYRS
jgi:hypothetical protein